MSFERRVRTLQGSGRVVIRLMKSELTQLHSFVSKCGILSDVTPTDRCFIVFPTKRILAGRFAILLQQNGVECRALGHGSGSMRCEGRNIHVDGILVLSVPQTYAKRVALYAGLFGVRVIPLIEG